jgi:hypothetical protein
MTARVRKGGDAAANPAKQAVMTRSLGRGGRFTGPASSIFLAVAVLALAACESRPPAAPASQGAAARLAEAMTGRFATLPDDPDNDYAETRRRVERDGAAWVFSELRTGPDRTLYRQRLFALTNEPDGRVRSTAHAFSDDAAARLAAGAMPESLSDQDLLPAFTALDGASCDMIWTRLPDGIWTGTISPEACRIVSPRRGEIGLEAESRLGPDSLFQTERGFSAEGEQLFGTPPGVFIRLARQTGP